MSLNRSRPRRSEAAGGSAYPSGSPPAAPSSRRRRGGDEGADGDDVGRRRVSSSNFGWRLRDSMRRMRRFRFPSSSAAGEDASVGTSSNRDREEAEEARAAGRPADGQEVEDGDSPPGTRRPSRSRNGTLVRVSRNRATNAIVTQLVEALVNQSQSGRVCRGEEQCSAGQEARSGAGLSRNSRSRYHSPPSNRSEGSGEIRGGAGAGSGNPRDDDNEPRFISSGGSDGVIRQQRAATLLTTSPHQERRRRDDEYDFNENIGDFSNDLSIASECGVDCCASLSDFSSMGQPPELENSTDTETVARVGNDDAAMSRTTTMTSISGSSERRVDGASNDDGSENEFGNGGGVASTATAEAVNANSVGARIINRLMAEEEDDRDVSPSAAAAQRAIQRGRRATWAAESTAIVRVNSNNPDQPSHSGERTSSLAGGDESRRSSGAGDRRRSREQSLQRQQRRQQRRRRSADNTRTPDSGAADDVTSRRGSFAEESWPHWFSPTLACVSCALNTFNVCRFALLSNYYGGSFILQFCLLSAAVGLPMTAFFLAAGQALGSGPMSMWRVCPIFRGVGVALLFAQSLLGVLASAPVSWLFAYLRDSFVSAWAECFPLYRECPPPLSKRDPGKPVADYFHGRVLDRVAPDSTASNGLALDHIKFEPAFHLAILWMIVLLIFSRGLRSYGKMVYFVVLIPVIGLCLVSGQLIAVGRQYGFSALSSVVNGVWADGFRNGEQWVAVAREVFFVWGLNGCAMMQMASHNPRHRRVVIDVLLIAILVMAPLLMAAFAFGACLHVLSQGGFAYVPSSFESRKAFEFLVSYPESLGIETRANTLFAGVVFSSSKLPPARFSGYTPMRFATEIFPATTVQLGARLLSPFWSMLFYFSMVVLGLASLLVIWRTVVEMFISLKSDLLRPWDVTISFLACFSAYLLALPFTSEIGIHVVYFWDSCVGSSWWIMVLYVLLLLGLLYVRGKPYGAEDIARCMFPGKGSCSSRAMRAFFAFIWTIVLPIVLLATAVVSFRFGTFRQMLHWGGRISTEGEGWALDENAGSSRIFVGPVEHSRWAQQFYSFWGEWARQIGGWVQVAPLLVVPIVAAIQSVRYLSCGSTDLFARMKTLYRPSLNQNGRRRDRRRDRRRRRAFGSDDDDEDDDGERDPIGRISAVVTRNPNADDEDVEANDPPPKYTPPPSYSTATGAMLAKYLRASFRRSVRRVQNIWQLPRRGSTSSTGGSGGGGDAASASAYSSVILERSLDSQYASCCGTSNSTSASASMSTTTAGLPPPPSYAAIALVESLNSGGGGVTNPSFISDDPSGNDSISEVPRESHYTLRAAEVVARRGSIGSLRAVTPPPDYDGIFATGRRSTSPSLTPSRLAPSPCPPSPSPSQPLSVSRFPGSCSTSDVALADACSSVRSSPSRAGSLKVLRSLRRSFQLRQFPPARRAHSTELVSVSAINLEAIDSTDA